MTSSVILYIWYYCTSNTLFVWVNTQNGNEMRTFEIGYLEKYFGTCNLDTVVQRVLESTVS